MKQKKQNGTAVEEFEQSDTNAQEDNGLNDTTNGQYSEEDKEKGNLKSFSISKKTIKKLKARSIEYLYPVQRESFATIYEKNDCVIQASNGSGKTLAFAIPIVELLQSDKSAELEAGRAPRALVIAPTRDTTKQISEDFESIVNNLTVVTIYSVKKKSEDQETAVANGCDILVATPDRLQEFIENEKVDLSQINHVILDEADRMLDTTVMEQLKAILQQAFTAETKPQFVVFSETMPDSVRKLTKKYLASNFATISVAEKGTQEVAEADEDEDSEEPFVIKSNNKSDNASSSVSLLSKRENYTTYQLSTNDEIKSVGFVYTMLRKCFGDEFDAKASVLKVAFTKDFKSAIFDFSSEFDEQLQSHWKDSPRIQMGPITELPELDESSMVDNSNSFGGQRPARGGSGAGGNRSFGKSNGCFKCGKEGHKSFECPDAAGGNKSGGGCFNCGKDGHKSFECPEPKKAGGRSGGSSACFNCGKEGHRSAECSEPRKAGGRGGGAGQKSNACFNCGKEGHRSAECSEPRKSGGRGGGGERSNACFNCGNDGHKSFECPEPKKGRPSGGPGGRGGRGGGGGFGAKRSFGNNYENSFAGDASNKKIKFDEDDD